MATVLYWNINNYTENRVSLKNKRTREDREYLSGPPGPDHLQLILDTCNNNRDPLTDAPQLVDFIVVVEVYNRIGVAVEGQTVDGTGLNGCLTLLNRLGNNWSLVPPVVTGAAHQREAIAVFYRSDRWYFLGPETWPQAYPENLRNGLPDRNIPAGYPYRANQPERRSAGDWQFQRTPPPGQGFPQPAVYFPGNSNRKPWLTAFGRVGNNNLLVRLTAIHTKPNQLGGTRYADQATANLADVYAITAQPPDAANQIDVILGDFNVDNMDPNNFQAGGPFGRLVGQGVNAVNPPYTPLLSRPPGLLARYTSYYHTHGKGVAFAKILDEDGDPIGDYPGYRYTDFSIDNVLVRYQGLVPPLSHMTIVNRVLDTPYTPVVPPPVPPPQLGYYRNRFGMETSVDALIALGISEDLDEDLNEEFRNGHNYGLIHRVSDHFALLFDI